MNKHDNNQNADQAVNPTQAFLVGVRLPETPAGEAEEMLDELGELTRTLGLDVCGTTLVHVRTPQPRYLVGSGKATEIIAEARACGAGMLVFDDPLSPSQQRNWEALADLPVIDRQEVILDIFAARAQTSEAVLQVELARATYDLPRLRRRWTHLHRQRGAAGGHGMRGEGEQQIEVDSRMVRLRIAQLKRQLAEVGQHRRVQRRRRLRKPVPVAAIVGYTNAGKSSLLNALTNANVFVEDKLFATLDPTVRRLKLTNQQDLLLIDTVGFVRKLPHLLVEAFKSTLEETATADFLIEVIDVTGEQIEEHHRTTCDVLAEIGAGNRPVITVLNKVDCLTDPLARRRLERRYPHAVMASAKTGEGLDLLLAELARELDAALRLLELHIPHARYDIIARLHRSSAILEESAEAEGVRLRVRVPPELLAVVLPFVSENRADSACVAPATVVE